MILVTGTKRSGTSMWMQILRSAGLPSIGDAFPGVWAESIGDANPRGFHESLFRNGVYWATNPHPRTGHYLRYEDVPEHVVKVFVPGLIRTERGFVGRVVGTVRPWRAYCASMERLLALEDAHLVEHGAAALEAARAKRSSVPHEITWWTENYDLLRDALVRGYPLHLVTYPRLLGDPDREVGRVLRWLGREDRLPDAVAAIEPGLRTQDGEGWVSSVLEPDEIAVFDELVDRVHHERGLPAGFLGEVNRVHAALSERFPG